MGTPEEKQTKQYGELLAQHQQLQVDYEQLQTISFNRGALLDFILEHHNLGPWQDQVELMRKLQTQ